MNARIGMTALPWFGRARLRGAAPRPSRCPEDAIVGDWEARIWLDRREIADAFRPSPARGVAAWLAGARHFVARMQMGPLAGADQGAERLPEDRGQVGFS